MVQHGTLQQLQRFELNIQPRPRTPKPSDVWSKLAAQLEAPRTPAAAATLNADTHDTAQAVDASTARCVTVNGANTTSSLMPRITAAPNDKTAHPDTRELDQPHRDTPPSPFDGLMCSALVG